MLDNPVSRRFQVRFVVRASFFALLLTAVLMPYFSIKWQKVRSYKSYISLRDVRQQQIIDKLSESPGQLALFNPDRINTNLTPLRPVVLPYRDLQTDDPHKVLSVVRAAGCPIKFISSHNESQEFAAVCVAVGRSDEKSVHGRIFIVGNFISTHLVAYSFLNSKDRIQNAHRINLELSDNKSTYRWVLPVQVRFDPKTRRPIDGYALSAYRLDMNGRPNKGKPDFTGAWIDQGECLSRDAESRTCLRESVFSVAIPRDKWGEASDSSGAADSDVGPRDLSVRIAVILPEVDRESSVLLDSQVNSAKPVFGAGTLLNYLDRGEKLIVKRRFGDQWQQLFSLNAPDSVGKESNGNLFGRWVLEFIPTQAPMELRGNFKIRDDEFEVIQKSTLMPVDADLADNSARMAGYAIGMIVGIGAVWLTIEIGLVRRVMMLTRRTRGLSRTVRADGSLEHFNFSDLRGGDELGVLAVGIDDLLRRIAGDVQREAAWVQHQTSILRAIGHEIRSPLQSLSAIYAESEQGRSYIKRMFRAVDALYGSASPSTGIEQVDIQIEYLDLVAFLTSVAKNAPHADIDDVVFEEPHLATFVRADPSALEDVLTHILSNANRYRPPGTAIALGLKHDDGTVSISISNHGPRIPDDLIDRLFEYGVSDQPDSAQGNRGQGLFVAKTYLTKMGGTIMARNDSDGVSFVIRLPLSKV